MPRNLPNKCKECGKARTAKCHISRSGLCAKCARDRWQAAVDQAMEAHQAMAEAGTFRRQ